MSKEDFVRAHAARQDAAAAEYGSGKPARPRKRYYVVKQWHPGISGWVSVILDGQSDRRILIAGADHEARAYRRLAELEAEPQQ